MAEKTKFLQDEWKNVASEVSEEEKWVLKSLSDTQIVEKNFEHKSVLVSELLVKLQQDENTLVDIHKKLTRLIADWTGDFQKEVRFAKGPQGAEQIYVFLQQFQDIEKSINADFENSKKLCTDIRSKYENMTVKKINEDVTHHTIVEEIKSLLQVFAQWSSYDQKLSDVVKKCNEFIKTYAAQSKELDNYKNIQEKLDDLIQGKGRYSAYSLEQRKAILARYARSNEYALKKKQDVIAKINAFMKEGSIASQLVIEEKKDNNAMYFNDSLQRLRQAGFKRHLRPVEYFEIIADVEKHGDASPYKALRDNLWSGRGEWLNMAVKIEKGMLYIAFDPENLAWDGERNCYVGNPAVSTTINASNLKADSWNEKISEFSNYFGVGCKGIYLNKEGQWAPVSFGDSSGSS